MRSINRFLRRIFVCPARLTYPVLLCPGFFPKDANEIDVRSSPIGDVGLGKACWENHRFGRFLGGLGLRCFRILSPDVTRHDIFLRTFDVGLRCTDPKIVARFKALAQTAKDMGPRRSFHQAGGRAPSRLPVSVPTPTRDKFNSPLS